MALPIFILLVQESSLGSIDAGPRGAAARWAHGSRPRAVVGISHGEEKEEGACKITVVVVSNNLGLSHAHDQVQFRTAEKTMTRDKEHTITSSEPQRVDERQGTYSLVRRTSHLVAEPHVSRCNGPSAFLASTVTVSMSGGTGMVDFSTKDPTAMFYLKEFFLVSPETHPT